MPRIKLSVIVVTYNSAEIIGRCLADLPVRHDLELLIVDNASSDTTVQVVRSMRADATLVENTGNVGFAKAVNQAAASASGEVLLLLNPDAVISGDSIDAMLELFGARSDVDIAAPFVREGDGSFRTIAAGYAPNWRRMFAHASGLSRLATTFPTLRGHYLMRDHVPADSLVELDWVSGGCMFVRSSLWTRLNGMSERWFMYAEDIEFCLRARAYGSTVVLLSNVTAEHEVGASSAASSSEVSTLWLSNLFDLYKTEIASNRVQAELWRLTVMLGYDLRANVLGASRRRSSSGDEDIRRFRAYAAALRRTNLKAAR